jgi:xanthine dehydrogenase accessory factor
MEIRIMEKLSRCMEKGQDVALVTVTNAQGSSPRGVGSMMLVDAGGRLLEGTVGGGAVEEKAKQDGAECIKRGISKTIRYELNLSNDKNSLNMACGGTVDVFFKVFKGRDELVIIGAGHIGDKLSKVAHILGYHITVIDDREGCANEERFPEADILKVGDIGEILENHPVSEKTNIVIITHGHKHDQIALEKVINTSARYIGMIGSRNKIALCFKNMTEKGFDTQVLSKVHAPIGLDIGGETPEEIAVAIIAEIQAVRYNKTCNSR